jgi:nitrate reductase gamma subunit
MWNSIYYFVMVPMVYLAFATLILGIIFKLLRVVFSPSIPGTLAVFPLKLPRTLGVLKDSLLVPTAWRKSKIFWLVIMAFHVAFLLLILGHLELIKDFRIIQVIPHEVFLGAGWVGIVLTVTTLYFLMRRFSSPVRQISIPEDYILLILLFLTIVFGSHMHLAARYSESGFDIQVEDYRAYLSSIFAFKPAIPEEISDSPHYIMLVIHIFLANLVMIFFPFSKMIHSVFVFVAQRIKRTTRHG